MDITGVKILNQMVGAIAPLLHSWVATLGPMQAMVLALLALLAIWLIGRMLSKVMILVPGTIAGVLIGWWCYHDRQWHLLLAIVAGVAASGVIYRIFGNFYLARLTAALVAAPIAVWILWRLATGVFDPVWAAGVIIFATATMASLLRIFIASEDQALRRWAIDGLDLIRGD